MTNLFGLGHIAQLHEIQSARLKRNQHGIGPEIEELIARLRDGGVLSDTMERTRQTKVLWDLGFGRKLGFKKFEDYLATIPEVIPYNDYPELFDRLVLVERRLSFVKSSKLLGLEEDPFDKKDFVNFYNRKYPEVEFVWCQDGRKNRNKSVRACCDTFVKGVEIGMTAIEGLCLYAQKRTILVTPNKHIIDFPGSLYAKDRDYVANLDQWCVSSVEFKCCPGDNADPGYGSASRRA